MNEKPKIIENTNGQLSKVPFAEPFNAAGYHSPYYSESHKAYRLALRKYLQDLFNEKGMQGGDFDVEGSHEIHRSFGKNGILAAFLGPGPHIKFFPQLGGVKAEEFDAFHELILQEETITQGFGATAFITSIYAGMVIGLPPLLHFGTNDMKTKIVPKILAGEKKIVLAISEPAAGSDVAQITTTARKTPDGKFYIVNGVKKWITGGPYSDYFTTAVRTGAGKGPDSISMLLIERSEGVETKPIKSSKGTDTAYITFENVKVPVENLLGKEGDGMFDLM